jgi:DNA (cytosine-5)-methyltransferase 1
MATLTIGSLFSGIGGLELGLERAGLGPVLWQVEQDDYCRRVLARHWPNARRHVDVKEVSADELEHVDIVCGGFPCQDISHAGRGAGLDGERSGLWSEYVRLIRALRPRYVVVENVSALIARGLDRVLGDLAELGLDAEWSMLSACAMGAPHTRERLFIVAHSHGLDGPARVGSRDRRLQSVQPRHDRARARDWAMAADASACRDVDGVSPGVERRLRALGNAVVPECGEAVGRLVLALEAER